ncbi:MAG: SpoIIE family protein phosphatase [Leptospiraceae bacterium]|nr:SpoIIE family protein phosphatase [Leptospiraceae bacterium]
MKNSEFVKWELEVKENKWISLPIPANPYSFLPPDTPIVWLRCKFYFSHNVQDSYSLYLGAISDRDKTYLNGVLIGETGEFGKETPQAYDKPRIYKIPIGVLKQGENVLLIKVERYFPYEIGILDSTPVLGSTEWIYSRYISKNYKDLLFLTVYFIAGNYFLFLYWKRKKDVSNLLFSLSSFGVVVYQFLRNPLKFELDLPLILMKKIEYIALALSVPFYCNFMYEFFRNKFLLSDSGREIWLKTFFKEIKLRIRENPFLYVLNFLSLIGVLVYFVSDSVLLFDKFNKNFMQPIFFLYCAFVLYYLIQVAKSRNTNALYMLIASIIMVTSVILDILSDRGYFQFPRTVGYFFLAYEMSIALILANNTVRLQKEVEELNQNLEKKVFERTQELYKSLEEIKELKLQQDADYFLTSLLIQPLIQNENKSENIKTEVFLSQKKKFEFRKKQLEIGGDLNLTNNVQLKGKEYTLFINGDAMGKSMQGAGGVIVFGVVLRTILVRSHTQAFKGTSPEKWLRDVFLELQKAFETFNGSMYISLVMGLIEEKSGLLYYLNAEHPKTVLLRMNQAYFLEEEQMIRKLGIPGNEEIFQVITFPLQHGDILIAGSDGRDDLVLGELEGVKIYNEDEWLFLKKVEESKGDLNKLVSSIQTTGELTDDFSLLKVEYKNPEVKKRKHALSRILKNAYSNSPIADEQTIQEKIYIMKALYKILPNNETANYFLALYYFRKRQFERALHHVRSYNQSNPDSLSMLYLEAKLEYWNGNYEKFEEILEVVKIRNKNSHKLLKLQNLQGKKKRTLLTKNGKGNPLKV